MTKTELNGHKVKHNKDATIVCEICGKTMREKYLRIHKQQVHGNASKIVKGPDCPYTNPKISAVKDHVIKHDTIGWFKCSHCGQVYRHKHCLKGHLKHVHNIEVGNYALNACRLVNSTVIGDQQHLNDSANAVQTEGSNIQQKPSSQCHIENIPIDNINNTGISVEKVVFSAEVLQLQPLSTELSERKTAATADNTLNRQKVSHHSGVNYAFKQTSNKQVLSIPIYNIINTGISVPETVDSTEVLQQQQLSTAQQKTTSTSDNTVDRQKVLSLLSKSIQELN